MAIADGDTVTLEYIGRLDDGTVFDTSREEVASEEGLAQQQPGRDYDPLTVEVGAGKLIEGLESHLVGMEDGDTDTVTIPPEQAYGEWTDERVAEYDADEFDEMLQGADVVEGMQVQTEQGTPGEVVEADDDVVRVDFNHELAGETLEFEIEIVDVN
jgi:FKBP-type peptidyl-prolyl cis-trans isomerase 2